MLNARYTDPPFRITRMSHVVIRVTDLDASLAFYQSLAGLVLSRRDDGAAYLRGVEETSHHSLVLIEGDSPSCDAIGLRVFEERDLDLAETWFDGKGIHTEWTTRPGQDRTLLVRHPSGVPIELTARMERLPRPLTEYSARKGASVYRLDHVQILVPDVAAVGEALMAMGFRAAEIIRKAGTDTSIGMFLHRKNVPHDIVLSQGAGPRLHHFSYVVSDLQAMFKACDVAGEMGIGTEVERGPGRHGPGNSAFVYFRDPDGHRIENILPPMQIMDPDEPVAIWSSDQKEKIVPWGQPAPMRWREEASLFTGVPLGDEGDVARWSVS